MSFGKSKSKPHRHRPKPVDEVEEVDEDKVREKREDKLNTQMIPKIITAVGSIAMLGIVVIGAPYSYGSQREHYSSDHMRTARNLADASKKERTEAGQKIFADFTNIAIPPSKATSEAMKRVATTCRQGRSADLTHVPPNKLHRAFEKTTKFMSCSLATEVNRLCYSEERKFLVDQLMEYKEKRQSVIAFEKFRDKTVSSYDAFRETQRLAGQEVPKPLDMTSAKMDPEFDKGILRNLEVLIKNGYLSASDFGYYGFYVPVEYAPALSVGSERYAPCETRT